MLRELLPQTVSENLQIFTKKERKKKKLKQIKWRNVPKSSPKSVNLYTHTTCSGSPVIPALVCHKKRQGKCNTICFRMRGQRYQPGQIYYSMTAGAQGDLLLWWHTVTGVRSVTRDAGLSSADEPRRLHRCSGAGCGFPLRVAPIPLRSTSGGSGGTRIAFQERSLSSAPWLRHRTESIWSHSGYCFRWGGGGGGIASLISMRALRGLKDLNNNAEREMAHNTDFLFLLTMRGLWFTQAEKADVKLVSKECWNVCESKLPFRSIWSYMWDLIMWSIKADFLSDSQSWPKTMTDILWPFCGLSSKRNEVG